MVAGNVQKWNIQHRDDVFKIGVGQVSTPDDQFDIVEMTVIAKTVESFNDFVADSKDFHSTCILP